MRGHWLLLASILTTVGVWTALLLARRFDRPKPPPKPQSAPARVDVAVVRPLLTGDYDTRWPAGTDPAIDFCTLDDLRWLATHGARWLRILPAHSLTKQPKRKPVATIVDAAGGCQHCTQQTAERMGDAERDKLLDQFLAELRRTHPDPNLVRKVLK